MDMLVRQSPKLWQPAPDEIAVWVQGQRLTDKIWDIGTLIHGNAGKFSDLRIKRGRVKIDAEPGQMPGRLIRVKP